MAMGMRTSNPALSSTTFSGLGRVARTEESMSIQGATNKTLLLLLLVCLTASWTWGIFFKSGNPAAVMPLVAVGGIGGFIVALVTIFKTIWAGITAPIYALLEGLVIGGISSFAEAQFPGIVVQAVGLTFGSPPLPRPSSRVSSSRRWASPSAPAWRCCWLINRD